MICEDIRHIIQPELQPGEELLWTDKPRRFPISPSSIYLLLFSVVWVSILLVAIIPSLFEGGATTETVSSGNEVGGVNLVFYFMLVFISIFVFLGAYFFYVGVKHFYGPSRQIYGLTTKRVIIMDRFLTHRIASIRGKELHKMVRNGSSGIGSLQLGEAFSLQQVGASISLPLYRLLNIRNPKNVELLIFDTLLNTGDQFD